MFDPMVNWFGVMFAQAKYLQVFAASRFCLGPVSVRENIPQQA
jgi:hypothetical protein